MAMAMNVFEEERHKMPDSNLSQQMSSSIMRGQTDEQVGDALRLFLQDMMTTIQSLLRKHESIYQSCKHAAKSMQYPLSTTKRVSTFEVSMAPSYSIEREPGMQEPKGCNFEAEKMNAIDSGTKKQLNGENLAGQQPDIVSVDALRGFLEDMKKSIQAWSDRHNLLQGMCYSHRKHGENISSLDSSPASMLPSSSGLSYFESIPIRGATVLAQSSQMNQEVTNFDLSTHVGADMVRVQSDKALQANRVESTSLEGNMSRLPGQANNLLVSTIPVFESSSKLHSSYPGVSLQHSQINVSAAYSSGQPGSGDMVVELPPQHNTGKANESSMPKADQETKTIESAHVKMQGSGKDAIKDAIIEAKANGSGKASAGVRQIVACPSRREAYTVESPDWLPKGWTTEVRIRGSGNSVGTKDKYYFDPVSNRRFRSKKEVFCFLETGKLGRYKPKSKRQADEENLIEGKPAIEDKPAVAPQQNKSKSRNRNRNKKNLNQNQSQPIQPPLLPAICLSTVPPTSVPLSVSTVPSTSVPVSAGPPSFPPPGIFSSFFMPYRLGQPSDWLIYDGLSGMPIPFFDHFPYPDKDSIRPNGSKFPSQGPWFFSNAEKPRKHYPKRAKRKAADEGKASLNPVHAEEGLHASETVQQPMVQQPTMQQQTIQQPIVQQATVQQPTVQQPSTADVS